MLFNSVEYLFFLIIIVVSYFSVAFRYRIWLLLAASYFFYMQWRWEYAFLILYTTLINYYFGGKIGHCDRSELRRIYLTVSIAGSLLPLFFFKYYNFSATSLNAAGDSMGMAWHLPVIDVILPVGISFFTFQALSYSIDVYRGRAPVEPHFAQFAVYVAFFPQLVAGPIERATHLLGQFRRQNRFDVERLASGSKLILWGLFKKVVIADRLAEFVDRVYAAPEVHSGSTLLLATYFFAFQIYCDFSGYTDIARGSARILGYDLMLNFNFPYLARSIEDFWRRWHISLSTWFRDYVYIPLGGSRVSEGRWLRNILVVFVVSGLWHGAAWTFVIWGALHGVYYVVETVLRAPFQSLCRFTRMPTWITRAFQHIVTFHLVVLAWVFFRAQSLNDALLITHRLVTDLAGPLYVGPSQLTTFLSASLIVFLVTVEFLQYRGWLPLQTSGTRLAASARCVSYAALVLGIALLGKSASEFIYFQF